LLMGDGVLFGLPAIKPAATDKFAAGQTAA
jgi:hypothetical protein